MKGVFPGRPVNGYRPRGSSERWGLIYVVETTEIVHRIKVGFTSGGTLSRVKVLETACPMEIRVVGYWKGFRVHEWEAQQAVAEWHARGEWFHGPALPAVVAWLNANCEPVTASATYKSRNPAFSPTHEPRHG